MLIEIQIILIFVARVVQSITKHSDNLLANQAKSIVESWTSFHMKKLNQPKLDVLCDNETNAARQNYRNQIKWVLSNEANVKSLFTAFCHFYLQSKFPLETLL